MVKVVSLSNTAYQMLTELKEKKESFSDIVIKLAKRKKSDISEFFGIWKGDKEIEEAFKKVERDRKKLKLREVKL